MRVEMRMVMARVMREEERSSRARETNEAKLYFPDVQEAYQGPLLQVIRRVQEEDQGQEQQQQKQLQLKQGQQDHHIKDEDMLGVRQGSDHYADTCLARVGQEQEQAQV